MLSDSASSEVIYTSISSHGDSLAWAVDLFGLQEPDLPEAAPASPDYVPGPEEPEYVADSDPEEDPEDGPIDSPADKGDNDDDDSSDDDKEDEETSKEEGEEHLAPADFVVAPAVDHAPSSEETELFETNESAATPPRCHDHDGSWEFVCFFKVANSCASSKLLIRVLLQSC
ncbi:hypothetical protein Tco_0228744 [Tanacetum coccineum]